MAQHQTRTGPITNAAAPISVEMLSPCLPQEKSHFQAPRFRQGWVSAQTTHTAAPFSIEMVTASVPDRLGRTRPALGQLFIVPDAAPFAFEGIVGTHPDTGRPHRPFRGQSYFPFSDIPAAFSVEMAQGTLVDRRGRTTTTTSGLFGVPDVQAFSIEMVIGSAPDRARLPKLDRRGVQLSQTTHTSATFSVEMSAGSAPPRQRYTAPEHRGWQFWAVEVPVFSMEMVQGSRPDRNRVQLGPKTLQPWSQTTHTAAPFSIEMAIGVRPPQQRKPTQGRVGWLAWVTEVFDATLIRVRRTMFWRTGSRGGSSKIGTPTSVD